MALFTTVPQGERTDCKVVEWYRTRWQVELVLQRFQSMAQLESPPRHHPGGAKAWPYGKLLADLLVEKLISHASSIPADGYALGQPAPRKRLAWVLSRVERGASGHRFGNRAQHHICRLGAHLKSAARTSAPAEAAAGPPPSRITMS